jgi:hypothetical protein
MQVLGRPGKFKSLERYTVPYFHLYAEKNRAVNAIYGCGYNTFGILTGRSLRGISDSVTDEKMIKSIERLQGYKVFPLSVYSVVSHEAPWYNAVREDNVVLISQLITRNEGTWALLYKNLWYHNGQIKGLHSLEFIVRPILTAYVIWNKKWCKDPTKRKKK